MFLQRLIEFSIKQKVVVLLLAGILIACGTVTALKAPWDIFPEFAPPQFVVQTEAPGLSTTEVELLVTAPIESCLNGIPQLRTVRSSSTAGLSVVTAIFHEGSDVLISRQLANERLSEVRSRLPKQADSPRLTPLKASTSRLLMIGLTSSSVTLQDLRTFATWNLKRQIEGVSGVAQCEVFGGEQKQFQIFIRPSDLVQHKVSLDQIVASARKSIAAGGAGFLETENQRLAIQLRSNVDSPEEIQEQLSETPVLTEEGITLKLGDVSEVKVGRSDAVGDALINGKPGVLLVIHKQMDANTIAVTKELQETLALIQKSLPTGVEYHPDLFRQATFIERAIGNLTESILIGCGLVVFVLIAFLMQWRTVVISLIAIPLSLLGALLSLRAFGASLNAMTLGGLAIALGELVDDAVVDVENVWRRLKENASLPNPEPLAQVILKASLEVRSAVVYASFIVILVFLPVFFVQGLAGKLFTPLGLAYAASILFSLLVALTVTPALCALLLSRTSQRESHTPLLVRILIACYKPTLAWTLRGRWLMLPVVCLAILLTLAVFPFLGGEFLPDFRESNFVLFMSGKPASSLVEAKRIGTHLAQRLQKVPGVESIAQQIGRAELSEDTWGPEVSEIWIRIDPDADYETVLEGIQQCTEETPGQRIQVKQFLRERVDEVLTGNNAEIVIRVFGDDLSLLRNTADKIGSLIEDIPGLTGLQIEQLEETPQILIALNSRKLTPYGLSVGDLTESLQTLLKGATVGQVYEHDKVFDVVVRSNPESRYDPSSLGDMLIHAPSGETIPLRYLADIQIGSALHIVNREKSSRRITIAANTKDRDVTSIVGEIQRRLDQRLGPLPTGYRIEFEGEHIARAKAQSELVLMGILSLVGVFILLFIDFQSVSLTLLIMLSVPLSIIGGIVAVLLSGGNLSLGSLVGFITLFGIAIRNGILMVSHLGRLDQATEASSGDAFILQAASERLSPILMTALCTGLALLPLVISGNLPGHEIEHPMAIVIVGGLISSTLMTLYFLPVAYRLLVRRK